MLWFILFLLRDSRGSAHSRDKVLGAPRAAGARGEGLLCKVWMAEEVPNIYFYPELSLLYTQRGSPLYIYFKVHCSFFTAMVSEALVF